MKRLLDPKESVLLIVDLQEKLLPLIDRGDRVAENARVMIEAAKLLDIPIVVSEHYPKGLGKTVKVLHDALPPGAAILSKTAFGCLGDLGIADCLKTVDRPQVMVAGIEAHVCVNQSVHQLLENGYEPHLITEAISSRTAENRRIGLEKMTAAGAVESSVETALFELLRDSKNKAFKAVQALIK